MKNPSKATAVRRLTQAAVIAAAYTALSLIFQPLGFGPIQCRVSEALTVLPVLTPAAVPGLAVGCCLSNLIGLATGANPVGGWDLLFGTAATAGAAWLSFRLRRVRCCGLPLAATVPPVLINAAVVGTELWWFYRGLPWGIAVACVAAGQTVTCIGGGLLLFYGLHRSGIDCRLSD